MPLQIKSNLLTDPIAVVCHDAGAANHIAAWIKEGMIGEEDSLRIYLEGPAKRIWRDLGLGGNRRNTLPSLEETLNGAGSLIAGSGWGSSLEFEALRLASMMCIPSVGVVDHWVNYAERFERNGIYVRPSEIWVTDSHALDKARSIFTNLSIRQIKNVYLTRIVSEISALQREANKQSQPTILFALEPARSMWGRTDKNGEFQALDYLVENIGYLGFGQTPRLVLRPHPSDELEKYDSWISSNPDIDVTIDQSPLLAQAIASVDCVVGLQSYALVVALAAGKKVFSVIPPWGPNCVLPYTEIIHLKDLIANASR